MNRFTLITAALVTGLASTSVLSAPKSMIIHNQSDRVANVFVDSVAGPSPVRANSSQEIPWFTVKMGCHDYINSGICPVVIKVGADTPFPLSVGTVSLNLNTGMVTPAIISGNGYTMTAIAPGETILTKD